MRVLFENQGGLDEFKGDGLLADFGVPTDLPDKERLAVDAARAIREVFEEIADRHVETFRGERMLNRSAMATGYVSVGYLSGKARATYGIVDSTVNLAARLQGQASPGEILLARVRTAVPQSEWRVSHPTGLGRTTFFALQEGVA